MRISNSQMLDANKCELRFYYAHVKKLRPRAYPAAMKKGLDGHELAEIYFRTMMNGGDQKACEVATSLAATELLASGQIDAVNLSTVRYVFAFGAYCFNEGYHPVALEESHAHEYGENEFVYTLDGVFKVVKGVRRGSLVMFDFKFTGQEWNQRQVQQYQQVPKYIIHWNLENPDNKISRGAVINFLVRNTTPGSGPAFVIKWLDLDKGKMETIEKENEEHIIRTAALKTRLQEGGIPVRTVDDYQCKTCFFGEDLCPAFTKQQDTKNYEKVNYVVNTYFDKYDEEVVGGREN